MWEKRMMSDDNQSSSPSTVAETKPQPEEETEEKVQKSESEPSPQKMSNGFTKHIDSNVPDSNANHIHECNGNVVRETSISTIDADQENNNNSADSLEEDNNDFVEEKTYTSSLEQAFVMKEVKEVTAETTTTVSSTTTAVEEVRETQIETTQSETTQSETTQEVVVSKTEEEHHTQNIETTQIAKSEDCVDNAASVDNSVGETEAIKESVQEVYCEQSTVATAVEETIIKDYQEKLESLSEKMVLLDVKSVEDDEDGFVPVEECLPKEDNPDEEVDLPTEHFEQSIEEPEIAPSTNGFGEHLPLSPTDSTSSEKVNHPEMEQFVKSGGVKRIIPGVQKTEQPYSTCTTETKIAMEIREMREREEELRIMREQALVSPAASPVPPKTPSTPSIRSPSPSPSPKEGPSPIPQGPGYRVSSVFGHKGAISPSLSINEEKKQFKTFSKESAVEREIRLAKDREEELRKQKGLPPREDDSYVKPSEVKSSQVRVFGKVGTNTSSVKQAATAKIQLEIEEQTQREMALRETGNIQTISQERTDAKVAKLKPAESPVPIYNNGSSVSPVNGTNGHSSPDFGAPYKRSSPSPTNARPASIFAQNTGMTKNNINMHKFITSKGKETTFNAPRNGPFVPKDESIIRSAVPPAMIKLKRNVSVESKIQQEIMEMKQREEELKKLHMNMTNGNSEENGTEENGTEHEMNQKNTLVNEIGNGIMDEELSPRHNKLIAQWEQRIQKAES